MPRSIVLRSPSALARSLTILFLASVAWASIAEPARAQVDFVVHGELGGAAMLSTHQRRDLGFDNGFTAMVRPAIRFADFFDLELNVGSLFMPTPNVQADNIGRVFLAGGGIRFEPRLGNIARLAIDGHVNYTLTGELSRVSLDTGLILEFQAGNDVGIGPYVRYTHVFPATTSEGPDAMMLSYGLSVSVGTQRAHVARLDTDGDGYFDDDDVCINEPAGNTPDREREGCPLADSDRDGVSDVDDVCPHDAAGSSPDPQRRGCPLLDSDRDGIEDRQDLCPNEARGAHPDAARLGCPAADTDGDGVYDLEDICPTTPAGPTPDPLRAGCPDADDDSDGVLNAVDECRTEHAGFHPDPAHIGCPLPDRDHDMIPDATDHCPDEPGAPSSNPLHNGCPGLVVLHIDSISIEQPVYFATGRDVILSRSHNLMLALTDAMQLTPEIRHISIEGHTDDVGTEEANMALSQRRAASVMAYLVAHGIEASRLEAHGFGESRPMASGTSREAREENRRVEFRVTDPAPRR